MHKSLIFYFSIFILLSCGSSDNIDDAVIEDQTTIPTPYVSAVDISQFPKIEASNPTFFDREGNQKALLNILKESGVNTVRLKLWVNPTDDFDGLQKVKEFSQRLKGMGFRIWLTLHYSDTWADPGNQETPAQWKAYSFAVLKSTIASYTQNVMNQIQPDFVQIGNEINSGFLHPFGERFTNKSQFLDLLATGIQAVRSQNSATKIILHYAGHENADVFFNGVNGLDYDIIGLSYYPIWHGKSLSQLQTTLDQLARKYDKEVIIAETAYPFTLGWNDWTNNIVGLPEQLLPNYPATEEGQKNYVEAIVSLSKTVTKGIGFCYWGAELIAWKGTESEDASPWENQALFDFTNQALPVLTAFAIE